VQALTNNGYTLKEVANILKDAGVNTKEAFGALMNDESIFLLNNMCTALIEGGYHKMDVYAIAVEVLKADGNDLGQITDSLLDFTTIRSYQNPKMVLYVLVDTGFYSVADIVEELSNSGVSMITIVESLRSGLSVVTNSTTEWPNCLTITEDLASGKVIDYQISVPIEIAFEAVNNLNKDKFDTAKLFMAAMYNPQDVFSILVQNSTEGLNELVGKMKKLNYPLEGRIIETDIIVKALSMNGVSILDITSALLANGTKYYEIGRALRKSGFSAQEIFNTMNLLSSDTLIAAKTITSAGFSRSEVCSILFENHTGDINSLVSKILAINNQEHTIVLSLLSFKYTLSDIVGAFSENGISNADISHALALAKCSTQDSFEALSSIVSDIKEVGKVLAKTLFNDWEVCSVLANHTKDVDSLVGILLSAGIDRDRDLYIINPQAILDTLANSGYSLPDIANSLSINGASNAKVTVYLKKLGCSTQDAFTIMGGITSDNLEAAGLLVKYGFNKSEVCSILKENHTGDENSLVGILLETGIDAVDIFKKLISEGHSISDIANSLMVNGTSNADITLSLYELGVSTQEAFKAINENISDSLETVNLLKEFNFKKREVCAVLAENHTGDLDSLVGILQEANFGVPYILLGLSSNGYSLSDIVNNLSPVNGYSVKYLKTDIVASLKSLGHSAKDTFTAIKGIVSGATEAGSLLVEVHFKQSDVCSVLIENHTGDVDSLVEVLQEVGIDNGIIIRELNLENNSTPTVEDNNAPNVENNSTPTVEDNNAPNVENNSTPTVEDNNAPNVENNTSLEIVSNDAETNESDSFLELYSLNFNEYRGLISNEIALGKNNYNIMYNAIRNIDTNFAGLAKNNELTALTKAFLFEVDKLTFDDHSFNTDLSLLQSGYSINSINQMYQEKGINIDIATELISSLNAITTELKVSGKYSFSVDNSEPEELRINFYNAVGDLVGFEILDLNSSVKLDSFFTSKLDNITFVDSDSNKFTFGKDQQISSITFGNVGNLDDCVKLTDTEGTNYYFVNSKLNKIEFVSKNDYGKTFIPDSSIEYGQIIPIGVASVPNDNNIINTVGNINQSLNSSNVSISIAGENTPVVFHGLSFARIPEFIGLLTNNEGNFIGESNKFEDQSIILEMFFTGESVIYKYDETDKFTKATYYNSDGQLQKVTIYTYSLGALNKTDTYDSNGILTSTDIYDNAGKLFKRDTYDANESTVSTTIFSYDNGVILNEKIYDKSGLLTEMRNYDNNGVFQKSIYYEYSDNNLLARMITSISSGRIIKAENFYYDDHDNLQSISEYDDTTGKRIIYNPDTTLYCQPDRLF